MLIKSKQMHCCAGMKVNTIRIRLRLHFEGEKNILRWDFCDYMGNIRANKIHQLEI